MLSDKRSMMTVCLSVSIYVSVFWLCFVLSVGDVSHTLQSVGSESGGLLFISFPQSDGRSKGMNIHTNKS